MRSAALRPPCGCRCRGFTLIELLAALLVLSLLALMSYRGLGAVLEARKHVTQETEKWQHVAAFFTRFERDVDLADPRPVRADGGSLPAWLGRPAQASGARLEFSRFASIEGTDNAQRIGYRLDGRQEIELWLWPGLDRAPGVLPARYPVLTGVSELDLQYLDSHLVWRDTWPASPDDAPIPLAVRVTIVLTSGEKIMRLFALQS